MPVTEENRNVTNGPISTIFEKVDREKSNRKTFPIPFPAQRS